MSYQKKESKAVDSIKKAIPSSLKADMLRESRGMFSEVYETKAVPNHYVATAIDGVGTKLIIAEAMGVYDTIGIDLVAMSANDLATLGAVSPFMFMDYLACQSKIQEKRISGKIVKGKKGLRKELVSSTHGGYGLDIAGCMIVFIKKKKFKKKKAKAGDKIIAL